MNQLINPSKLEFFLGTSTIDDSCMVESTEEVSSKQSTLSKSKKSKIRVGSGNYQLKHKKGLLKGSINADISEQINQKGSKLNRSKDCRNSKTRAKNGSTSPFLQQHNSRINGKMRNRDEKSTDADEDSKTWGLAGKAIDKRNSTKATNVTNSENGDSSWVKSKANASSGDKTSNLSKISKRGNSMANRKQKSSKLQENTQNKIKRKILNFIYSW